MVRRGGQQLWRVAFYPGINTVIEKGDGGYVFRPDEQFIEDVEARLVPGFEAADVARADGAASAGYSAPGNAQ